MANVRLAVDMDGAGAVVQHGTNKVTFHCADISNAAQLIVNLSNAGIVEMVTGIKYEQIPPEEEY